MKAIDLTNQRFGRLTVIEFYGSISKGQSKPVRYWVCKCDCGNVVTVSANSLRQGQTFSCGCLRSERLKERKQNNRSLFSIDRIDNNGNYEPSNCRWVDNYIQANNKRNIKQYTYKGRTQSLSQWAREMGINLFTLYSRINRLGWSLEEALTTAASYSNCIERGTAFWLKEADD